DDSCALATERSMGDASAAARKLRRCISVSFHKSRFRFVVRLLPWTRPVASLALFFYYKEHYHTDKQIVIRTSTQLGERLCQGLFAATYHAGSPAKETTMTLPYHLKRAMLVLAMLPAVASAQNYPDKPLRFIVPYPAGGPTDVVSRVVSEALA